MNKCIVLSVVFNRPRYIPYQYECLKKFITIPFEYIIFDNSKDDRDTYEIQRNCEYLDIKYYRVPQNIHVSDEVSNRAGLSLDYALRFLYNQMAFRGIVMVCDSDLFLIKSYNPIERIADYDFVGRSIKNIYEQVHKPDHPINLNKLYYYSNQFMLINYDSFSYINDITFVPVVYKGIQLDCGGQLYSFFNENKQIKHLAINDIPSSHFNKENVNINNSLSEGLKDYLTAEINIINGNSFSEIFDDSFIHFRAGSNWCGHSDTLAFNRENNLFTYLCNKLIDWNIKNDSNNKHIISYSLYGNKPKYTFNAVMNALIAKKIYKGWICRYYYDHTVPENIINVLSSFDNVEVCKMESISDAPTGDKMFWRFLPAGEPDVAVMISRDCDSWLSFREACSIKKWIESEKQFHILRDHCYHSQKIMGGIWGVKRGLLLNIKELYSEFIKKSHYDQQFLAEYIYPKILETCMVHIGQNQKMMGGIPSNGYFTDGGVEIEPYFKILEYIPSIDIEKENHINKFRCLHCGIEHNFFVGEMFNNLSVFTIDILNKYNINLTNSV